MVYNRKNRKKYQIFSILFSIVLIFSLINTVYFTKEKTEKISSAVTLELKEKIEHHSSFNKAYISAWCLLEELEELNEKDINSEQITEFIWIEQRTQKRKIFCFEKISSIFNNLIPKRMQIISYIHNIDGKKDSSLPI